MTAEQLAKKLHEMLGEMSDAAGNDEFMSKYEYVLLHGIPMEPADSDGLAGLGAPQACFANAQMFTKGDFHYAEGFAIHEGLPIILHHAWVIDGIGRVLDPTPLWDHEVRAYYGVTFDQEAIEENISPENLSVIDQWQKGFPLLKR